MIKKYLKIMMSLITSCPLVVVTSCAVTQSLPKISYQTVFKIVDGDTIKLSVFGTVRIFGIDAPESFDAKNNFQKTTGLKYLYATLAKRYVQRLIFGKKVKMRYIKLDVYERKLGRIEIKNVDVALSLVAQGLAKVAYISDRKNSPFYTPSIKYFEQLKAAEKIAKWHQKGFWQCECMKKIY